MRRHRVEAPFDGVVSDRSSELGEWVTPGDALLMLVDTDHLRLDIQIPRDAYRPIGEGSELLIGGVGPEGDIFLDNDRLPAKRDRARPLCPAWPWRRCCGSPQGRRG